MHPLDATFLTELRSVALQALRALAGVLDAATNAPPERRPPANQVRLAAMQVLRMAQVFLAPAPAARLDQPRSPRPAPAPEPTEPLVQSALASAAAASLPLNPLSPSAARSSRRPPMTGGRLAALAGALPVPT